MTRVHCALLRPDPSIGRGPTNQWVRQMTAAGDPRTIVRSSTMSWLAQVGMAESGDLDYVRPGAELEYVLNQRQPIVYPFNRNRGDPMFTGFRQPLQLYIGSESE